ncbi:MAG: hypothetical protein AB7O67_05460 [Vicinamibacterales bacterium]
MDVTTRRLVAAGAILAPTLHSLTDVLEWAQEGFSPAQLWLNYLAFLPVPAVMLGLYAAQRPRISRLGLVGALVYGFAFVYFAHTTLVALTEGVPTYAELWAGLGAFYTAHGALMVAGGLAFGGATARAGIFPAWTAHLFIVGIVLNLVLALVPLPELLQTVGTALRNAGLVGMGLALVRHADVSLA